MGMARPPHPFRATIFQMKLASRVVMRGGLKPPGDKSIAHRMALLGPLAPGNSVIENFAPGDDCRRTLDIVRALGLRVEHRGTTVAIQGKGLFTFCAPGLPLDAGNSGSTARMTCGLLVAQPFDSSLDGDESLRRRPMGRIIEPLELMGAQFETQNGQPDRLPLVIRGGRTICGIDYDLPVASAQVKTAVLLAGLHAEGVTRVRESYPTRDHTELALARFGVPVRRDAGAIVLRGMPRLEPIHYRIPGDISSAAFFVTAAAALPGSDLVVQEVGLNPTRTGFLKVLMSMGADIRIEEDRFDSADGERWGTVRVKGGELTGTQVQRSLVPTVIDEIPVLAVAAALAHGKTAFHGVSELRHKESDRLQTIAEGISALGAKAEILDDLLLVHGGRPLRGARLESHGDHRMAMAWAIASLAVSEDCQIVGQKSVNISYPEFWEDLDRLVA